MTHARILETIARADRKLYPLFGSTRQEGVDYPGDQDGWAPNQS